MYFLLFYLYYVYCREEEEKIDNLSRSLYLDTLMKKIQEGQLSNDYKRRFKNLKYTGKWSKKKKSGPKKTLTVGF